MELLIAAAVLAIFVLIIGACVVDIYICWWKQGRANAAMRKELQELTLDALRLQTSLTELRRDVARKLRPEPSPSGRPGEAK